MPFEQDLASALDQMTDTLDPDLTALVNGGVARARRRGRRRRAGVLAGVGSCVALVVGGALLSGATAGGRGTAVPAATRSSATEASVPSGEITGALLVRALEGSLPGGTFSKVSSHGTSPWGSPPGKGVSADLLFDDGHGASAIGVSLLRDTLPLGTHQAGLDCDAMRTAGNTCEIVDLPGSADLPGGTVVMFEQFTVPDAPGPYPGEYWTITLTFKASGAQLVFVEWNGTGAASAPGSTRPATRPAPPFTEQQVVADLTDSAWQPVLGSLGLDARSYPSAGAPPPTASVPPQEQQQVRPSGESSSWGKPSR